MECVGPLQIRILHLLWTHGPNTVQAVHAVLSEQNQLNGAKTMAYTTVLTVMRNLVRRNILSQVKTGRAHRFTPLISCGEYQRGILRQTRYDLFHGDARALLRCLADDDEIDTDLRRRVRMLAMEESAG